MRTLKEEKHSTVFHFYVAFSVFNLSFLTCSFVCEVVMTHRNRFVTEDFDGVVVKTDFSPWFQSEAFVFRVFWVSSNKVGESSFKVRTERLIGG